MEQKKKDKFDEALDILEEYTKGTPPRDSRMEAGCWCGGHEQEHKKKSSEEKEENKNQ